MTTLGAIAREMLRQRRDNKGGAAAGVQHLHVVGHGQATKAAAGAAASAAAGAAAGGERSARSSPRLSPPGENSRGTGAAEP
mmetsp:Transcript_79023/g.191115  ORF Transcript_79023/g.191115 Transcript_79023/m.191115 type:complete len:82 (+) Transcript_79023:1769-2014(+)